jgi:hypothetical protein
MKTRRGGNVDRKVRDIVQLYQLGDSPLREPNAHVEDNQFEEELMDILSGMKRTDLHKIVQRLLPYHGSDRIIPMIRRLYIRTKGGTRKKGGAWSLFGPPKEDKFADEIIADPLTKATAIIRSPTTNLERLRAKIVEKDTAKKLDFILHYIDDEMKARRYNADQNSWT